MLAEPPRRETTTEPLPRAFNLFWAGQALSALGDAMTVVAMPLLVLAATGSVTEMGRLTAASRGGGLIATALAGSLVDRRDPRRVMLVCDVARFALMASVPLAWGLGLRQLGWIFVVGIGAALAQGIFYVGHVSLVAELVGRARVALANSRVEGSIALAYVFGPLLAGVLSAHVGPARVLGIDAATFLASVLALLAMGKRTRAPSEPRSLADEPRRDESKLAGWRFLRRDPELSRLTLLVACSQFFTAAVVDLFIFRLKHDLRQSDTRAGIAFALASATAALAAAATPRLRARLSFHRLWLIAVSAQGVALLASAPSASFAAICAAAAAFMACMTTLMICQASIRQERTPQPLLGRVTSSYLVLVALPAPAGALLATALATRHGAEMAQAAAGLGLLLTALLAAALWSRMPKGEVTASPSD